MSSAATQILVSNAVLRGKDPGILGEMADLGLGQETYKMILEHPGVPES